jgi:hypothetical protein
MAKILEELQARVREARKRLDEANATLATSQQAQVNANHNFNVWSMAALAEAREEKLRDTEANEKQLPLPAANPETLETFSDIADLAEALADQSVNSAEVINKTDAVRELLRRHPAGMTAVDIWNEVSEDFKHRPYLYSVLKRLRDRDEVVMRRKKYYLKLANKIEEVKEQQSVVH